MDIKNFQSKATTGVNSKVMKSEYILKIIILNLLIAPPSIHKLMEMPN